MSTGEMATQQKAFIDMETQPTAREHNRIAVEQFTLGIVRQNVILDLDPDIHRDVDVNEGIPPAHQVVDHKGRE